MTVDTSVQVDAGFNRRWLTVKQMREMISELEDDDLLAPNRVGNLSIFRDNEQSMIGYIDFHTEELEIVA